MNNIRFDKDKDKDVAGWVQDWIDNTIFINLNYEDWIKCEKRYLINQLIYFISHETIHIVLKRLKLYKPSNKFDNITALFDGCNDRYGINLICLKLIKDTKV